MHTIEQAFDMVNDMNYITKDGKVIHGEQISLNEVRRLIDRLESPIEAYVMMNSAIYYYMERKDC